jgi:hypothetical protein
LAPEAIRRELEQQLDLDQVDLACWKAVIGTWIIKFNNKLTTLSAGATRSPKPKPAKEQTAADKRAAGTPD